MTNLSRREMLRRLAAGMGGITGALFLEACAREGLISSTDTLPPLPSNAPTSPPSAITSVPSAGALSPTDTLPPLETIPPVPTAAQALEPNLIVTRGGKPEELVQRALAALGGIEKFVPSGANVIIKPNICVAYHSYEYAATTNPFVVAELVRQCLSAGAASVRVMDYPFGGTAQEAYEVSGIAQEVNAAGGKMDFMPGYKYKKYEIPNAKQLKSVEIFDDIMKADVLINVPIAKHHSLTGLTLAMKNLLGVIKNREAMHYMIFDRLAELATLVKPTLNVVDAIRILVNNGPTGGSLDDVKKLDTVIMTRDIVAADSYATTLFGMKPDDLGNTKAGALLGVGINDLTQLRIEEIRVGA